jgi:hypothetical protein
MCFTRPAGKPWVIAGCAIHVLKTPDETERALSFGRVQTDSPRSVTLPAAPIDPRIEPMCSHSRMRTGMRYGVVVEFHRPAF